jgi:DNA-binding GntR family transcriptional regulator
MPLPRIAKKMSRTLARDEAYEKLRSWIIAARLCPGETLRDQDIATALGVSRTPVREALRRLEDEGLVETALNRWTRVAPLDLDETAETYVVVEALELLALELAFAKLAPDDLVRLDNFNRRMRTSARRRDPGAAVVADESFHQTWIDVTGNGTLVAVLRQLKAKLRRIELAYFDTASHAQESFREHTAIVRALRRRSLLAAKAALRRNWRGSVARLRSACEKRLADGHRKEGE